MNKKIERLTNILLAIACIAVLIHLANTYLSNNTKQKLPQDVSSGDTLSNFETFVSNPAEENLLIFLSSDCHYCEESVPFYKKIVEKEATTKTKVVFTTSNNIDPLLVKKMLLDGGVMVDEVLQIDGRQWKLMYTPSILLTNKKGKVIQYWKGQLDVKREETVLNSL